MRILIVGSGGREHALAWKLKQNPGVTEIFIAPGNGGTGEAGKNVRISDGDIPALMEFIKSENIGFVVPGPELPLVNGLVDACLEAGVPCFGPCAYAARLEGSKIFAKEVMSAGNIPTAAYAVFSEFAPAAAYVRGKGLPLVIKADGLAAGKGVVVAKTEEEAIAALKNMLEDKAFGSAADRVLIEDALAGEEVSLLAFCDGERALPLHSAQDHKAVYDGDTGPNTGGMGAYSPAPVLPDSRSAEMCRLVIDPVLKVMRERGHPFKGILYAGLMMTAEGPMVLEYNVRFGDPECQPLLMRLQSDLLEVMRACCDGGLDGINLEFSGQAAVCVVLTAKGYPGSYPKGMEIRGLGAAEAVRPGKVKVFQAGTKREGEKVLANGGRVLGVTALGDGLAEAQKLAYEALAELKMENAHFRRDIGNKGLRACFACKKG